MTWITWITSSFWLFSEQVMGFAVTSEPVGIPQNLTGDWSPVVSQLRWPCLIRVESNWLVNNPHTGRKWECLVMIRPSRPWEMGGGAGWGLDVWKWGMFRWIQVKGRFSQNLFTHFSFEWSKLVPKVLMIGWCWLMLAPKNSRDWLSPKPRHHNYHLCQHQKT